MDTIKNGGTSVPPFTKEDAIRIQGQNLDAWRTKLTPEAFEKLERWATEKNDTARDHYGIIRGDQLEDYVDIYKLKEARVLAEPETIMIGGKPYQAHEARFWDLRRGDRFVYVGNSTIWSVRQANEEYLKIRSSIVKWVNLNEHFKGADHGATRGDRRVYILK
jgi:hypothetical protein